MPITDVSILQWVPSINLLEVPSNKKRLKRVGDWRNNSITQKNDVRVCDKSLHMNDSQHLIVTFQKVPWVPIGHNLLFNDLTTELISSRLLSNPCRSNSQQGTAWIGV